MSIQSNINSNLPINSTNSTNSTNSDINSNVKKINLNDRKFKLNPNCKKNHFYFFENFYTHNKFINIEIGAGNGLFATNYCITHSNQIFLAIEKTHNRFKKLSKRKEKYSCDNLYIFQSNAIDWIASYVPKESIQNYYILYPNPYPKKSQKNKRWHNMPFINYLIETLKNFGTITLSTNKLFYYLEAKEKFTKIHNLKIIQDDILSLKTLNTSPSPSSSLCLDNYFRTNFEKKYIERNEICYNLVLQKI